MNLFCTILALLLANASFSIANDESDEELPNANGVNDDQQNILYSTPNIDNYYIYEHFDDETAFPQRWIKSETSKADSNNEFKYDGEWALTNTAQSIRGDSCLIVKSRARHHAISAKLDKVFKFDGKPLILQYEAQFRNGQECGGAYLKLLSSPSGDLRRLNDKTQYSIMFGPDKCGNDMKVHFIFQHKNPRNGTLAEKHWKGASVSKFEEVFKDNKWHQFRLVINPDNSYEVTVDSTSLKKGSLLKDFNPPVNPLKEIDDPNDSKPEDWDDREKIPDPDAVKPDDWDENEPRKVPDSSANKPNDWDEEEPEMIPDAEAKQPSDWDPEMDGEWEPPLVANPKCAQLSGCGKWSPPLIDNPKYKGKWRAPMISNPSYRGKWAPRKIQNPDFFEDLQPYRTLLPIDGVAFELWTISDGIAFDNILITDDIDVAKHISSLTYVLKREISDSETDNIFMRFVRYTNKHPWLWAVYCVAVGLPIVLFLAFCCASPVKRETPEPAEPKIKPSTSSDNASDAQRKKTDQSTPDVRDDDLIEEDEEREEELEEEQQEAIDENINEEVDNLEEEESEKEVEEEPIPEVRSSPRLRKTRSRKE